MGEDLSILELAHMVADQVGYNGQILTDTSKLDGTPRKLTDISLIKSTGWSPSTSLKEGLMHTYAAYLNELSQGTLRES
jgi:GDP-L-fucose synthase